MKGFAAPTVRITYRLPALAAAAALAGLMLAAGPGMAPAVAEPAHAIAMHGEPALPPGFERFAYTSPDARFGGRVTYASIGSFDSLNPLIVKGNAAQSLRGYVYESLMARALDEPFTLYGLIADSVETPPDRSSVTFTIDPRAHFSDGHPITSADVLFSWKLLRDHGRPNHRSYYSKVSSAEAPDERTVRFVFDAAGDREMPLIMGLMPVLPAHLVDPETFEQTTLTPPVGSGPYKLVDLKPGGSLTYQRDPDYWAAGLGVSAGLYNFDEIRIEYYRDENSLFEAFKKGLVDVMLDEDPTRWATGYDFPAAADGRVVKDTFTDGTPKGMTGFVFNTRRPIFADVRVREALAALFDFEWVNHTYFFDAYRRTASYFEASELSARGRAADAAEKALLAPFPDAVPADVMDGSYEPMATDRSGRDRAPLKKAMGLLGAAGYQMKDGRLVDAGGAPLSFEFLTKTRDQERLALAFKRSLSRLGIDIAIRTVDSAQYQRRLQGFDFDMIQYFWPASLSPGNEQNFRWSVASADQEGSFNFAGARQPATDAMIAAMIAAESRADFVDAVRALDRVLISGHYVVPLFHLPEQRVARWARISRPERSSLYGYVLQSWWHAGEAGK
ncbi:MAG: extracellular solute-binding protein [Hyphomicrobiales bacterium]